MGLKMETKRIFGEIEGINPGAEFQDRKALAKAGIHPPLVAGISGSKLDGADSIVLSGGYEDDEDFGNEIIYTGAGGQENGKQVSDQELSKANLALAKSKTEGLPVRVTRGHKHKNPLSPESGYRYAGLYYVEDYWKEKGKSGLVIWRYRLVNLSLENTSEQQDSQEPRHENTVRKLTTSNRVLRNHQKALNVKQWHNYQCQVCQLAIKTGAGLYAEGAHIKPLGSPHNGPDVESNLLCLCPNHHVMFDNGCFTIGNDLQLIGLEGSLHTAKKHTVNISFLKYHRQHYYNNSKE